MKIFDGFTFLVLLLFTALRAQSQSQEQRAMLQMIDLPKTQNLLRSDEATLLINQQGNDNSINWKSTQNNSLQFQQSGDRNSIETNINGKNNNLNFSQLGNDNQMSMIDFNASNTKLEIIQYGDGNQLIDKGYSLSTPLKIEQRGGMKIEISSILNAYK